MTYDKPVTVQIQDPNTELWTDVLKLHARVNKTGGGVALNAGADQYRATLNFEFRYVKALEDLHYSPQPYRLLYRGRAFKVVDYDDYMEGHQTIELVGEYYA